MSLSVSAGLSFVSHLSYILQHGATTYKLVIKNDPFSVSQTATEVEISKHRPFFTLVLAPRLSCSEHGLQLDSLMRILVETCGAGQQSLSQPIDRYQASTHGPTFQQPTFGRKDEM